MMLSLSSSNSIVVYLLLGIIVFVMVVEGLGLEELGWGEEDFGIGLLICFNGVVGVGVIFFIMCVIG